MYPSRENIKEMSVVAKEIKEIIGGDINEIMLKSLKSTLELILIAIEIKKLYGGDIIKEILPMSLKLVLELISKKEIMLNGYDKKYYIPKLQGGK